MVKTNNFRPLNFEQFIGQEKVKYNLNIYIQSAILTNNILDHTLIHGQAGLGKTSLAFLIAKTLNSNIKTINAPNIEKIVDIVTILIELQDGDVLFIDEIHRLNKNIEEVLYQAIDEYKIDIILNKYNGAQTITLEIAKFTLIGATTMPGKISTPLYSRFAINLSLEEYSLKDIIKIVTNATITMGISITNNAAHEIALRSRLNPRIAIQLTKRVYDFAVILNGGKITKKVVLMAMNKIGVKTLGLYKEDLLYLKFLNITNIAVGVDTIATSLNIDVDTIIEIIEPYLLKNNLIQRTKQGRKLTDIGISYINAIDSDDNS